MTSEKSRRTGPTLQYENELHARGVKLVAGVDEAGRGPLAGPVVAAAVILPEGVLIPGVDDSKKLTAAKREALYDVISLPAVAAGTGIVGHEVIDRINILQATYRAMHQALAALSVMPGHVLVDGNRFAGTGIPFTTIVDGDALSHSIAAASIIAKVTRDRLLCDYDRLYPAYGFARHKGYGTAQHRAAIVAHGPCPIHRSTFLSGILDGARSQEEVTIGEGDGTA
ncbi:MAG: ribonuclease HII [Ignavibacteriae bacterium]|nr:ribonuclease HII [Ignavibacteriota bacterium]